LLSTGTISAKKAPDKMIGEKATGEIREDAIPTMTSAEQGIMVDSIMRIVRGERMTITIEVVRVVIIFSTLLAMEHTIIKPAGPMRIQVEEGLPRTDLMLGKSWTTHAGYMGIMSMNPATR
jgi:hypothetical protein